MRRLNKKRAFFELIIVLALAFGLFLLYNWHDFSDKNGDKNIDIIAYGSDTNRWENLRQGAVMASEGQDVEINLITLSSLDDYEEQISLIDREINANVDGIILAPCDSKKVGAYLDRLYTDVPIIMVENSATTKRSYECIAANDYDMGYELGSTIKERENPIIKVAIVSENMMRDGNTKRDEGIRDVLEEYANSVVTWKRDENEKGISTKTFLQRKLTNEAVDVIVTLDNETTDALMDALDNLNMTRKVYSISTSDKSVAYVDSEKIKVLEYQTEFGIGYAAMSYILDEGRTRGRLLQDSIQYRIIDKENMYDYDNQMLIFPFVK